MPDFANPYQYKFCRFFVRIYLKIRIYIKSLSSRRMPGSRNSQQSNALSLIYSEIKHISAFIKKRCFHI
jgi:hypothetical protein